MSYVGLPINKTEMKQFLFFLNKELKTTFVVGTCTNEKTSNTPFPIFFFVFALIGQVILVHTMPTSNSVFVLQ